LHQRFGHYAICRPATDEVRSPYQRRQNRRIGLKGV